MISARDRKFPIGHRVEFSPTDFRVQFVDASPNSKNEPFAILIFTSTGGREVRRFVFPFSINGEKQTIATLTSIFGQNRMDEMVATKLPLIVWMRRKLKDMPCPERVVAKHVLYRGSGEWRAENFIPAPIEEDKEDETEQCVENEEDLNDEIDSIIEETNRRIDR